jgi:hypothetical protein
MGGGAMGFGAKADTVKKGEEIDIKRSILIDI